MIESNDVYLVVEDSPVYAAIAASMLGSLVGDRGQVIKCDSYDDAHQHLITRVVKLVVCGYGLGAGKTAHDIRQICHAPMVILTGRNGELPMPSSSTTVMKNGGPDRLHAAIADALARSI